MAVTLDASPASPTANSFATVEFADSYNESHLYGASWVAVDAETKKKALITATRLIVEHMQSIGWRGHPTTLGQALPIPRSGLYNRNGQPLDPTLVPIELAQATSEYGRRLVDSGAMPDSPADTDGIKSIKVGPIGIEFTGSGTSIGGIPGAIWDMISFLSAPGASSGGISVPLIRV